MTTLRDDSEFLDCAFVRETVSSAEILHVLGDIDIASIHSFERAVAETTRPARPLVVDLLACDYIGAAGFAAIVRAHATLGKALRVAVPSEGIPARLFSLLECHANFYVSGSLEGALQPSRSDARAF